MRWARPGRVLAVFWLCLILFAPPALAADDDSLAVTAGRLSARGWEHFKAGEYDQAADLFRLAAEAEAGDISRQARLGLGYAEMKRGRLEEARAQFESLAAENYLPGEVVPALLDIYARTGAWDLADALIERLPAAERETWTARLEAMREERQAAARRSAMSRAWEMLEAGQGAEAAESFSAILAEGDPGARDEAAFGLGYALWKQGRLEEARDVFTGLADTGYRPEKVWPALLEIQAALEDWMAVEAGIGHLPEEERAGWRDRLAPRHGGSPGSGNRRQAGAGLGGLSGGGCGPGRGVVPFGGRNPGCESSQ